MKLKRKRKQKKKEKKGANVLRQTCSRLAGLTVKRCHETGSCTRKGLRLDNIQLSVVIDQKRRNYRKPEGDWLGLRETCGDGWKLHRSKFETDEWICTNSCDCNFLEGLALRRLITQSPTRIGWRLCLLENVKNLNASFLNKFGFYSAKNKERKKEIEMQSFHNSNEVFKSSTWPRAEVTKPGAAVLGTCRFKAKVKWNRGNPDRSKTKHNVVQRRN